MACCHSCAVGKACESSCPDHVGTEPTPPTLNSGLIRMIGGVPTLIPVGGANPPLSSLLSSNAILTPAMVGPFLAAAIPVTGLPANIPGLAVPVALATAPPDLSTAGVAFFNATVAAWKGSAQGKSAGWQDPTADVYLDWLANTNDPTVAAVRNYLAQLASAAGNPAWLVKAIPSLPDPAKGKMSPTYVRRPNVKVLGYHDPTADGYL